jgi:hypothetical protein
MSNMLYDVTPDFRPNVYDSQVGRGILRYEGTPEAIKYFARVCGRLPILLTGSFSVHFGSVIVVVLT